MNIAKYRLLDYAVEVKIPMAWLMWEGLGETLNKAPHDLSRNELELLLQEMLQEGAIVLQDKAIGDESISYVTPSSDRIAEALNAPPFPSPRIAYALTFQGGTTWEALSRPNWDAYIHALYGIYGADPTQNPDPQEGEIAATNRQLVEEYYHFVQRYDAPIRGSDIIQGSETWEILEPWAVTYWKTLPRGHLLRFLYSERDIPYDEEYPLPLDIQEEATRWIEFMNNWYTRWDDLQS